MSGFEPLTLRSQITKQKRKTYLRDYDAFIYFASISILFEEHINFIP